MKGSVCNVPGDYKTIDAALNRAKLSGGEIKKIVVGKGKHKVGTTNCGSQQKTPCLCLQKVKGISIVGQGIGKTVLEGLVRFKNWGPSNSDTKERLAREFRLEDLSITNNKGSGLWIEGKGPCLKCVNIELKGCQANGALVEDGESIRAMSI